MKNQIRFYVFILAATGCSSLPAPMAHAQGVRTPSSVICNVKDHQAIGDGKTLDTLAIQKTIDACPSGGTVLLPAGGTFLSGTITLKSDLTFRIEPGAKLLGTQDTSAYPDLLPPTTNTQLSSCKKALIYAVGIQNVTIEGGTPATYPDQVNLTASGVIDGNGNNPNWTGVEATRPMAIFVALSTNITIHYVQVVNSGMWSVVNFENTNVLLQYVRVDSEYGPTRDGMDIVDSTQVLVDHCDVKSEDDSICLKSGNQKGLHHITVQNSHLRNSGVANALKIGTASVGPIDDIHFENIQIDAVKQAAMAVESVDGSIINGVSFKNIQFSNAGTAFFVLLGSRNGDANIGSIQNISFENVTGSVDLNWGSAISGTEFNGKIYPITGLSFKNVTVTEQSNQGLSSLPNSPPEYLGGYPDPRMPNWQPLPACGVYFRHVDTVSLVNTNFNLAASASADKRPEVSHEDDVKDFSSDKPL